MRNLKKILALVLALVMSMSMLATANAFEDSKDIDPDFTEAVDVLNALGVFQGYDEGKTFQPKGAITRAEVAAIIYRIVTGDVADKQVDIYADYNKFDDVASTKWYAGYVNFCANAEIIKGYSATKFGPNDTVTGYQALAMILRAIGYDKNGEFTGAGWQVQTAAVAKKLDVTKNIVAGTLGTAATREMVAEILFRTIAYAPQVNYTLAFGYSDFGTDTLGYETFKLVGKADVDDVWGRPSSVWYQDLNGNKKVDVAADYGFVSTAYAPTVTYTTSVTECDIANDVGFGKTVRYTTYTNGLVNKGAYDVQAKDTVQKLGAQGTLIEVYGQARIVMIDTMLAKVTAVKDATYDVRGHLKTESSITLNVYNNAHTTTVAGQPITLTNGSTNYEYAVGDYVLVNAVMDNASGLAKENADKHVEIIGLADTMDGAQTFLWYNSKQHTVEGETYDDAKWFKLDEAKTSTAKYTWFFDQYGNLIGDVLIATAYTYGIVENIQWINPVGNYGYAQATIRYMDDTTETLVVTKIDNVDLKYAGRYNQLGFANGFISTNIAENTDAGKDLFRIETAADGTVSLKHVFTKPAATEIKSHIDNAVIKTGISAVGKGNDIIYTNSNTVYLIQTIAGGVASYSYVTGYENMVNYSNATVDYVNTNGDIYADFVYVTGTPDSAKGMQMFYLTSSNVQGVLWVNGVKYFVLQGIVDGVPGEIKVADGTNVSGTILTDATIGQWALSAVNRMITVKYEDAEVIQMWGPKGDIADLGKEIGAAYAGLALDYVTAEAGATWDGEVLAFAGAKYNVVDLKAAYGEFSADMSNKNVYVVYNKDLHIKDAYVATAVYIVDVADQGTDGGVTTDWVSNGAGYAYNPVTGEVVAPANATLADLVGVYGGTVTATYYTTDANGLTTIHTISSDDETEAATTIDSLLAIGATVTLDNGTVWDVID